MQAFFVSGLSSLRGSSQDDRSNLINWEIASPDESGSQ